MDPLAKKEIFIWIFLEKQVSVAALPRSAAPPLSLLAGVCLSGMEKDSIFVYFLSGANCKYATDKKNKGGLKKEKKSVK